MKARELFGLPKINCPNCRKTKGYRWEGDIFFQVRKSINRIYDDPRHAISSGHPIYEKIKTWARHKCRDCGWVGQWHKVHETETPDPDASAIPLNGDISGGE